jgi:hypothetical protein
MTVAADTRSSGRRDHWAISSDTLSVTLERSLPGGLGVTGLRELRADFPAG